MDRIVVSSSAELGGGFLLSRRLVVLCFVLFLLGSPAAHSQFVHTQGTEIVGASGAPLQIRGISIGNWFVLEGYFWGFGGVSQSQTDVEMVFTDLLGPTHANEFLYNWRQNFMSKADVDRIKEDGFNTIRIPLHSKYFKTDDDEGFKLIDQLSKWCREDHIYIILMLESGIGGFTGEASDDGPGYPWLLMDVGMQKFVNEAWQRIANHYKDDPVILGYDLMNEPLLWRGYLPFENLIEPEYRRVTVAIREVDTHHMIILQPALGRFSGSLASRSIVIPFTASTATALIPTFIGFSNTSISAPSGRCRSSMMRSTPRGRLTGKSPMSTWLRNTTWAG